MLQNECRPYIIYREPPGFGFWSNFSVVLQGLDDAERSDLVPVIDMDRYATHYSENEPVHGTTNAWEYYFEQPTALTLAEALTRNPLDNGGVVKKDPFTSCWALIAPPLETVARGRELIRKYVRIKPEIQRRLDTLMPVGGGNSCVGVHVRGTDQRHGRFSQHPATAVPAAYLEQVVLLDNEHAFTHIVLATDEEENVKLFSEQFGSRLITIPAHRTTSDHAATDFRQNYNWLFDSSDRHLHRYQLGLEVLVDALLLSRCSHLVCGASNVSHAAMYFAAESQIIHAVPPLWIYASGDQPSRGRAYIASLPKPSYKPAVAVLEQSIEELLAIVEHTENDRAREYSQAIESEKAAREAQRRFEQSQGDNRKLFESIAQLEAKVTELEANDIAYYERNRALNQTNHELMDASAREQEELAKLHHNNESLSAMVAIAHAELATFRSRFIVRFLDAFVRFRRRLQRS